MLWSTDEIMEATGARLTGGALPPGFPGVSIDTRSLRPGELFVALPGDPGPRFRTASRSDRDGHDFLAAAANAGAGAALVHRETPEAPLPTLCVKDTLEGLWAMGRYRRRQLDADVVAVTGSSGKTTTKSLLKAALDAFAEAGSLNNHLGVPLSLARTPRTTTTAVYEIGTSYPGEIGPLSRLAQPDVAIVLNVQSAHIGNFSGREALRAEKFAIADGLVEGGTLIHEYGLKPNPAHTSSGLRLTRLTFGTDPQADVSLMAVESDRATYRLRGVKVSARIPGGGEHRARSLAAVLATLLALDRDIGPALDLPDSLIPGGRGGIIPIGSVTLIDDSYNANPDSMRAALLQLTASPAGRRFAVLGEMRELGDLAAESHHALAELVAPLDGFWAVGADMKVLAGLSNCLGWAEKAESSLLDAICQVIAPGDTLLLKGSNAVFWVHGFANRLAERLRAGPIARQ